MYALINSKSANLYLLAFFLSGPFEVFTKTGDELNKIIQRCTHNFMKNGIRKHKITSLDPACLSTHSCDPTEFNKMVEKIEGSHFFLCQRYLNSIQDVMTIESIEKKLRT